MRMYSLYSNKDFLGKYVRKEQAISDILDLFNLEKGEIYKSLDNNTWIVIKKGKIVSKYEIKSEEV